MCRLLQKTRKRSGPRAAVRLDRQCYIAAASKVSYDRRMGMMGLLYDRRMRSVDIDCRAARICARCPLLSTKGGSRAVVADCSSIWNFVRAPAARACAFVEANAKSRLYRQTAVRLGPRSATPANALHLTVEDGIFLVQWIIRIGQIFLRRHLIGARLAMTNRGLRNCRTCRAR